ncbi:MAG TPA: hypothetical protein PKV13_06850 [Propionicimonas sp.]|nr:hypothetical protein [Propionicimonas sp.]HRA06324.1 hypothetical protein [Propionicimonas sp.]
MPRRVGLPGASELFRTTSTPPTSSSASPATPEPTDESSGAAPSGRVRHEEKITVYVSSEELLALEQARLTLRAHHGLAIDRGRIVRTAIGLAMADLASRGAESDLVRELGQP